jgi:hypothetical protein
VKVVVRNKFHILTLAAVLVTVEGLSSATPIIGGWEDTFGNLSIAGPDAPGELVTFHPVNDNPESKFAPYSSDGSLGDMDSLVAAANLGESAGQNFALFEGPDYKPPQVPEPSSAAFAGIGVALVGLGILPRGKH